MGAEVGCGTASVAPVETASPGSSQGPAAAHGGRAAPGADPAPSAAAGATGQRSVRSGRFQRLLSRPSVDLPELRDLLWLGAPEDEPRLRSEAWQILLGYLPPVRDRQTPGVAKKRGEYEELKRQHYRFEDEPCPSASSGAGAAAATSSASDGGGCRAGAAASGGAGAPVAVVGGDGSSSLSAAAAAAAAGIDGDDAVVVLRQIRVDIPRTSQGGLQIFNHPRMHRLMERVLYIWSVRHPASGYVQGINDLLVPFVVVFLSAEVKPSVEDLDLDTVADATLDNIEAAAYWCLTKMLSDIQNHYTSGQPGIQQMVMRLKEIIHRIDNQLFVHLEEQGLDFFTLSFRWMNCLMLREFPLPCVIRLWDAYIAEPVEGFSTFHVYFCAVFLIYWAPQLKQMDFQQLMLFMQRLPTGKWKPRAEIETLLAEAYALKYHFHCSPKHFTWPPPATPPMPL